MLNMLKVHGGNRVAQRTGNRIESLNAGSPGSVIAGTESHYQATAVQLCPGISYSQRNSPSQKYITTTVDVQQPSQGLQKVGGCIPTAASPQVSSKVKSTDGTEGRGLHGHCPARWLVYRGYSSLAYCYCAFSGHFILSESC